MITREWLALLAMGCLAVGLPAVLLDAARPIERWWVVGYPLAVIGLVFAAVALGMGK